jgi:putative ABC transport system ATP-binding protein
VAAPPQAFSQRAKGDDGHLYGAIVGGHARAFGQGFINAVPYGANMTPALEARELWKLYQAGDSTVEAVRGVNVNIIAGEMVAVMGPSGCGKTTLLNILSGIDEPTAGSVMVNGQPLYGISDDARTDLRGEHFGFIFQDFNLLPVLSAVENVELPLLLKGQSPQEARNGALQALALVGLADRSEHRPAELSGGQQQRVAVARAIVHQPSIILCDEPTGNLDNATSAEVMRLLGEMNQRQGTTFLIVTHDSSIASQCQRTITMSDGNVLSDSNNPPSEEE